MTKRDKALIYHQRILGRMVLEAGVSIEFAKILVDVGSLIVSQLNMQQMQIEQQKVKSWRDKDYVYGLFGFRFDMATWF